MPLNRGALILCCTQPQRLPRYTIFTNERAFKTMGYISIRLTKPIFFMKPKINMPQSSLIKFSTFSSLGVLLGDQVIQIMIECYEFTFYCLTSGIPTHLPRHSQNKTLEAALVGVVPWRLVYIMLIIYLYIAICIYLLHWIRRHAEMASREGCNNKVGFISIWLDEEPCDNFRGCFANSNAAVSQKIFAAEDSCEHIASRKQIGCNVVGSRAGKRRRDCQRGEHQTLSWISCCCCASSAARLLVQVSQAELVVDQKGF